ncbi:hypothetical protein [Streptomyces sp. NPDC057702]|uniref:hypothetical protein n=1 Tax=unclassified Streptomyces TaxID=2593676 RepID=UPI0036AE8EA3
MDENIPLTIRQDPSDGYRLLPVSPAREPRDLVVCIRLPGGGQPMISLWGDTEILPRSRTREHWALLESDVRDIRDLSAQLLADWKAFVDYQPSDPAAGIRPYAAGADLSTRPPGEVRSHVTELARGGSHLLEELLDGNDPNLVRLRTVLLSALHRRDLRIRFDSDLDLPWPLLALDGPAPAPSGPPPHVLSYDTHSPHAPAAAAPYAADVSAPPAPVATPDPHDLPGLFDLFLGHRHLVEAASGAYETDFYYVASRSRPVSSANVDHRLRKTPRATEVHKLLDDRTELTERTHSDVLLADLAMAGFDEDLMYFFCHGAVIGDGDAAWQAFQLTDARSVHAGRIDSTRKRHTEANRRQGAFVPFHPMVVLNVCYAGSPMTGRFASLAGSFIRHGAQGVLAPHIAVPKVFGVEFALGFLTRYVVDRAAAGTAVRDTVRWFAAEYHNPLGLIYGLQCGLDSRLAPATPDQGATAP